MSQACFFCFQETLWPYGGWSALSRWERATVPKQVAEHVVICALYMYKFEKTCLKLVFWLFQETLWPYETFVNHSKLRHPLPDCYTPILISKTAK